MDLETFVKTAAEIVERDKIDQKALSKKLGKGPTYVRDILAGRSRDPSGPTLIAFAVALGLDPVEALGIPRVIQKVPVVGYIGAGAAVLPIDDFPKGGGLDEVPCPSGLNPAKTVCAIVRGDSMEPNIPDGWRVFYSRDPEQDTAGVVGKLCVVKITDGPTMLKQVRRGSKPRRYNLLSSNASLMEDQKLDWASPVRAALPPE